ncbi:MAG: prepilin-type N-terminal cleavage/methylation domain-containing protein [Chloroflexi bacterium]|nr:prepilin-type N-terminal cleavage/methylation domain-containing protein [Chloroflexota bacterium]
MPNKKSRGPALSKANGPALSLANGFTLVEIMIVLAVLAVLAAVVIPNVSGFLGRGKERAFDADKRLLQAAVDAWRTDIANRSGNPWPTVGGVKGDLADNGVLGVDTSTSTSTVIKVSLLTTGTYLKGNDVVKSCAYSNNSASPPVNSGGNGCSNVPVGSYVWYIDSNGLVQPRRWTDTAAEPGVITLAELAAAGFVTDVYP